MPRRRYGTRKYRDDRLKNLVPQRERATITGSNDLPSGVSSEIGELIEDERASEVAGTVIGEIEMDWLVEAVEKLPERHRRVLIKRYGRGDEQRATLTQLSEELGISRERVRQLQREAERMLAGGEYGALGVAA